MNYAFANRTRNFTSSAVRDILTVIQQGNVISFAGGLPAEEFFPVEQVQLAYERVFASGTGSLQYGITEGFLPLRSLLKERMQTKGIDSQPETIIMTTGSQQAIDLFSKVMLSPGDIVLTENPTYLAALQVFKTYEAQVCSVQGDEYGMDLEDLEHQIQMLQPKFIYVVPTFSNPEGKVWSQERRIALVELAKKYNVLVFEDDPYGEIQFNNMEIYQPLASLDQERTHVLYTSTFSKTVVPALRSGWITGPKEVVRMMAKAKQASDLHSSSIDQQALYFLMRDFDLNGHIALLRREYYQRMNVMRDYLDNLDGFSFIEPKGGMFIWVKANEDVDMTSLLPEAVNHGVAYVPGSAFYVDGPQKNTFRLNFTHATPEKLKLGMKRLSEVLGKVEKVEKSKA